MTQHRREIDPQVEEFKKLVERMEHLVMNAREQVPTTFSELFGDMQKRNKDLDDKIEKYNQTVIAHIESDTKWKEELLQTISPVVMVYTKGGTVKSFLTYMFFGTVATIAGFVTIFEGIPRVLRIIKGL